jgi:hypothetical protein
VEESVVDFLVDDFLVEDFMVAAGDFSGAVVVVDSFLLVQAPMSPAAKRTVME